MKPQASCSSRIKEGMKAARMKQVDLVEKTGIPKSTMSQYVNGRFKPKQDALNLIAKALNVDEAWLLGFNVPPERKPKEEYLTEGTNDLKELCKFLQSNPEIKALTATLREMTEDEIQELARYGKFLRARDGIK